MLSPLFSIVSRRASFADDFQRIRYSRRGCFIHPAAPSKGPHADLEKQHRPRISATAPHRSTCKVARAKSVFSRTLFGNSSKQMLYAAPPTHSFENNGFPH